MVLIMLGLAAFVILKIVHYAHQNPLYRDDREMIHTACWIAGLHSTDLFLCAAQQTGGRVDDNEALRLHTRYLESCSRKDTVYRAPPFVWGYVNKERLFYEG